MAKKDPRIDAYIAKAAVFAQPILTHLRRLAHQAWPEVEETLKWGMPAFGHRGTLFMMAAFKEHCTLSFWKGRLIFGAGPAPEEAMGQFGRITSLADLPSDKKLLSYIKKAVELNEAGVKAPVPPKDKTKRKLTVPGDLVAALKKSKPARATFEKFSYSHKKDYVEWITEAKREETRARRLQTTIQWLAEGKGRNWKYERC